MSLAAAAVAALVLLKLALETSYLSVGAWLAVPLAAVLLYGGYLRSREVPTMHHAGPAQGPERSAT